MTDDPRASTRSRENTRARLLDAAAEVFAEVGLGEASVERICERAGFTRGAFYSNFASKDEMFLQLAKVVAGDRVAAVRARVAEIDAGAQLHLDLANAAAIVRVLDVIDDDRVSTLLMHEISIRAMRDRDLGTAYAAQEQELLGEVVQIIDEIADAKGLVLRVPSVDAARIILAVWADVSARAAIAGLDAEAIAEQRSVEVGRVVQLVIEKG
ncbi:helix-turn-helix domain containing protein [Microbacterium betulae]|uniref:Helix-turn-helix domain containing protein n=1 Tax=Microbacterium betulae TaxID=2981139 RepID=A0AA97FIM0_9MICO|nr:helix-turn-helix domain-containing protein [Microbacterium sp. AB]WOF23608.1 helix-turn-helix domain containing protein [Microbacterium sp. AB]